MRVGVRYHRTRMAGEMGERASRDNIYPRLMITYVVSAFIAIAITSLIMTVYVRESAVGSLSSSVQASIQRTSLVLDVIADSVKTFALQLYFDRDISKLRNLRSPDVFDLSTATYRLSTFGAVLPYLESIYIYSDISGRYYVTLPYGPTRVYLAANFYDREVVQLLHDTNQYSVLHPISRQIPMESSVGEFSRTKGLTFVFYGPSDQRVATEGAVVLNMSQTWVQRLIGNEEDSAGGATLIVDESGKIAVDDVGNVFGPQLVRTKLLARVMRENHPLGHGIIRVGDRRYLVAYAEYAPFKWVLFRVVPLAQIISRVNQTVINALLICTAVLLLGLFASMIVSRRFLSPVRTLIARVYEMQGVIRVTREAQKTEYLKKLIGLSDKPYEFNDTAEGVGLNITLGPGRGVALLYLVIDRFEQLSARYNARERERLKRRIIELATWEVRRSFPCDGVSMDDERIVIFVDTGNDKTDHPAQIFSADLANAQQSLLSALDVSVSFIVSSRRVGYDSLPGLYEEVRAAAPNRFVHGPKAIVFCDDPVELARKDFSDFEYPIKRERAFIKLLMSGGFEKAQAIMDEILSSCLVFSFGAFQLVLARLVFITNSSLAEIERIHNVATGRNLDKLIMEIGRLESYSEVRAYFQQYFESLATRMSTTTDEKHQQLLKRIAEILSSEYSNRNLSLQYIAGKVGMSPPYLSRLYHRLQGQSIVSEINRVRIQKAKRMLKDSGIPIENIIQATGFSNSQHFFRVFRQRTGMTPREFRDIGYCKPA